MMPGPTVAQIASDLAAQWEQVRYARLQFWAAVAQVGGSILAILAAYWMGRSQFRATQKVAEEDRERICQSFTTLLLRQFRIVRKDTGRALKALEGEDDPNSKVVRLHNAFLALPNCHELPPLSEIALALNQPARDVVVDAEAAFAEYRGVYERALRALSKNEEMVDLPRKIAADVAKRLKRLDDSCVMAIEGLGGSSNTEES